MPWARYKRMCCAIKLCHCERSEAIPRHCEDSSLRAAFSREELSDVAGSNPQPRTAGSASPPCCHNVGCGRPAPRGFELRKTALLSYRLNSARVQV